MSADQASYEDPADVRPGRQLGRYRILTGIAQGGMARVWSAQQHGQRGFSKIVAIKTILPSLSADPQFETMFLDEARVAAMVHHPHVCEIFDLGDDHGVLYLAMEWVDGESLARVIKFKPPGSTEPPTPKRLNPRGAARIIADAAAGLHAAHELADPEGRRLDVVHRDVSPQNILVGTDGIVKVTDFGVAKALGSMQEVTMAGQIKGKAAYMSPEQAGGGRVDRRSDIFALGICLYEATTGRRPFDGENQLMTLRKVMSCEFDPPSATVPGYPKDLEDIVMRAMARDPMSRFPTAERMQHTVEEWLARSGPLVTRTQVGTMVRDRVGAVVEERKERIRKALRTGEEAPRVSGAVPGGGFQSVSDRSSSKISQPSSASHPSSSTVSRVALAGRGVASRTPPPSVGKSSRARPSTASTVILGIGIGLAAFVVIGGISAVGYYVLGTDEARVAAANAPETTTPEPRAKADEPEPSAEEPEKGEDEAKGEAKTETPIVSLIELDVSPKEGVSLELDGEALTAGTTVVEKPPKGERRKLIVNAPGHEQKAVFIDEKTPETLRIELQEAKVVKAPDPPAAAPAPAPKPEKKKKPPIQPDIPENPF